MLFTDIVGSTKRAAKLGDRRWRALLAEHNALMRAQVERCGGREIVTTGDGFLVTFDTPVRAIRCAKALIEDVRELGISIRAGVHVGECERLEDGISGIAVHLSARIMAKARASELLASSTVCELVQGSGIEFRERGTYTLKGVPGVWSLYTVGALEQTNGDGTCALKLMLVDDHPLWRETLRNLLERDGSVCVVAEVSDGAEVVAAADRSSPDVVVMDMSIPSVNGVEATRRLLAARPETKVLVLSSWDDRSAVLEAVKAGASGYLLKTAGAKEVADGVKRVHAGELVFPPSLAGVVLAQLRTEK